jgi:hypothetical protein
MRDALAVFQFHDLVGQQPEIPAGVAFRRLTTSQGCNLGSLSPANFGWTPRAGGIFKTLEALLFVLIAPGHNRDPAYAEGFGHGRQSLAAIEFQQRRSSFKDFGRQFSFGD